MAENRWQIAIGAVVLLLMLLIGTFSLGVYIGRHGLSREGLLYQPVQQIKPQALQPADRPSGIPQGEPDLIGKLRSGTKRGIELATKNGIRFVAIDENTRLLNERGETLEGSDLRAGDILAIFGEFRANEGQQLLANVIVRIPEQRSPQP
jgi:hypothetical protein